MPMKKLNVAFLMLSEKKSPGKKRSVRVRARVWVRLGLGLGLGSGAFFPGGGFFLEAFFIWIYIKTVYTYCIEVNV